MAQRDYYDILGIPRDADKKTLKDAYHRLAMKWHPDRNKAPDAEDRFKEVAKAYAVLSDPKKRARYDATGEEGVAHFTSDDLFRNVDLGSIFGDAGFGFGPGGDSVFDRFFGGRRRAAGGEDLTIRLEVPLERVAEGGKENVHFSRLLPCGTCHGFGTRSKKPAPPCPACGGTGHRVSASERNEREGRSFRIQQITVCPDCQGRGTQPAEPCHTCGGRGQTAKMETLKVNIPRGIEDGMVLRVAGHGHPGQAGEPVGDLLLQVVAAPDPRFQRRGADLWRGVTLDVVDAVLGTELKIPTLDGEAQVTVPAGTQPDEILRLRGKGLPRFGDSGHGDLKLRIAVHLPETLSSGERELYEKLKQARRRG
jgi:molecular chaperone DnaJ